MSRKIIEIGSSVGITLPQHTLRKLGLSVGDEVEIKFDEGAQTISINPKKETDNRDERIARRTMDFIDRYRSDLEALADK